MYMSCSRTEIPIYLNLRIKTIVIKPYFKVVFCQKGLFKKSFDFLNSLRFYLLSAFILFSSASEFLTFVCSYILSEL